jgi:hypothetical protein
VKSLTGMGLPERMVCDPEVGHILAASSSVEMGSRSPRA